MSNATRNQTSIAELEKKMDDRHEVVNARLEQMSASIARFEQLHTGIDEIRRMLLSMDAHSNNNEHHPHADNRLPPVKTRDDGHNGMVTIAVKFR